LDAAGDEYNGGDKAGVLRNAPKIKGGLDIMQVRWEYLTPPEFKKLVKEEQICILPLGILERHGEHLPYGTDGLSVHAIACRAAELEPCVVFPTYWFGQGHEASCFAGSVNFPPRLLYEMLEVLLDQIARNGFKKIVIFSGHGGNSHFLDYFAMTQLDREVDYTLYILRGAGKRQLALADMWETKYGHAGEEETSQIMAITPEGVVKLEQQVYEEPILPRMDLTQQVPGVHSGLWWYAKYPLHVTESPSHATKEKGERMIEARVLDLADRLRSIKEDKVLPSLQQEFYERVRRVPEGD